MVVVVGIPSYKNEKTIKYVAEQAAKGLSKFAGGGIILNADGSPDDKTKKAFLSARVPANVKLISFRYKGVSGKGSAVFDLIEKAKELNAEMLLLFDADLRSIEDWWIKYYYEAIKKGADFVAPYYIRHKYDGTITNNIIYPLIYSLYGYNIRQPIGGDFGISRKLFNIYLNERESLPESIFKFGIDIYLTTTAITNNATIAEAFLGAKIHDPKDPGEDLKNMFLEVVSTYIWLINKHQEYIKSVSSITIPEMIGEMNYIEPEEIKVDVQNMIKKALTIFDEHKEYYQKVFSKQTLKLLKQIFDSIKQGKPYEYSDELWAKTLYDMLAYYNTKPKNLEYAYALYLAKTADFIEKTQNMTSIEAENLILSRTKVFFAERSYLFEEQKQRLESKIMPTLHIEEYVPEIEKF